MKQRFYSIRDKWTIVIFPAFMLLSLFLFSILFFGKTTPPAPVAVKILVALLILGLLALFASIFFGTWYVIDGELLTCRCGPVIKKIPISKIRSISKPKRKILNQSYMQLALSFTQIVVSYNSYDDVSISPADYDGFVSSLKSINPAIVVE